MIGRILALSLTCLSALALYESYSLKVGTLFSPGPGFLPFFSSLLLMFLSGVLIFKEKTKVRFYFVRPLLAFSLIFVYAIFLEYLGFLICTFLLMVALFLLTGEKLIKTLAYSFVFSLLSLILFRTLLKVPLPKSPILGI